MAKQKKTERTRMNTITACISTTLMLILLGLVVFFVSFAHEFSDSLKENFTVTLMLDENVTQSQAYNIQKRLKGLPCTRSLCYVSKEKALKEQSQALGTDPTEFLGYNPMPASFEVRLKAEYANSDSLKKILPPLRNDSLIVDVTAPQNLMDKLNNNIRHISTGMLIVAMLLTIVSFVLINNTIRLSVYARRHIIRTMRLVGASYSFIRRPFVRKALLIGLVSALFALVAIAVGVYYLITYEPQLQDLVTTQVVISTVGIVIVCGLLLTWVSAYVSVTRYLKMTRHRIFRS